MLFGENCEADAVDKNPEKLDQHVPELEKAKEDATETALVLERCVSEIQKANILYATTLKGQGAIQNLLSRAISFVKIVIILIVSFFVIQNCPLFNQAFPEPLTWWIIPILVAFMFLVNRYLLTEES